MRLRRVSETGVAIQRHRLPLHLRMVLSIPASHLLLLYRLSTLVLLNARALLRNVQRVKSVNLEEETDLSVLPLQLGFSDIKKIRT